MKYIVEISRKVYEDPNYDPFSFQIITPRRFGHNLSAYQINKKFRETVLSQSGPHFIAGDKGLCSGRNTFELINGDFFKVLELSTDNTMKVHLEIPPLGADPERTIPRHDDSLMQGWAITIHKYQGCEAPYIIIPITKSFGHFPSRAMMYTALTRAQKKVFIVGERTAFMAALENEDPVRDTGYRLGVVNG